MNDNTKRYKAINRSRIKEKKIKAFIPVPTELDRKKGYIRRYFIQKTNDKGSPIFEISVKSVSEYSTSPLFTIVDVKWRIKGPKEPKYDDKGNIVDKSVQESNRIAIRLVAHKIPNLKLYLPNLLQFYKS